MLSLLTGRFGVEKTVGSSMKLSSFKSKACRLRISHSVVPLFTQGRQADGCFLAFHSQHFHEVMNAE